MNTRCTSASHEILKQSHTSWHTHTAPLAGYSDAYPAIQESSRGALELRDCRSCDSTLARPISAVDVQVAA